jgi:Lon protease-like protein
MLFGPEKEGIGNCLTLRYRDIVGKVAAKRKDNVQCADKNERARSRVGLASKANIKLTQRLSWLAPREPQIVIRILKARPVEERVQTVHPIPETLQQVIG